MSLYLKQTSCNYVQHILCEFLSCGSVIVGMMTGFIPVTTPQHGYRRQRDWLLYRGRLGRCGPLGCLCGQGPTCGKACRDGPGRLVEDRRSALRAGQVSTGLPGGGLRHPRCSTIGRVGATGGRDESSGYKDLRDLRACPSHFICRPVMNLIACSGYMLSILTRASLQFASPKMDVQVRQATVNRRVAL